MKKTLLSFIIIGACSVLSASAGEFTPLNFDDATYTSSTQTTKIASSATSASSTKATPSVDTTGGKNMQSAISQLDSAQVEVRNELLNYKTKYSEVDAKYESIKAERSNLSKQIKACEKKIRRLDNAKEKIKKNMV